MFSRFPCFRCCLSCIGWDEDFVAFISAVQLETGIDIFCLGFAFEWLTRFTVAANLIDEAHLVDLTRGWLTAGIANVILFAEAFVVPGAVEINHLTL